MQLTGAQVIIKVLQEEEVETVFGYPGGQVIPLYDALYDAQLHHVLTAHEQGAIHAADGFARSSGKPGVCIATSGPGATNLVTGLATAFLDSTPLVALTGQVPQAYLGRNSFQEVDVVDITKSVTKFNAQVTKAEDLAPMLRRAFRLAKEGRPGPVLVDIPSNLQKAVMEYEAPENPSPLKGKAKDVKAGSNRCLNSLPAPESVEIAAQLIRNAKRPVLLVGGGAALGMAEKEITEFALKTGMPVVHTLMGIGVFSGDYPQNLGLTGMHGHKAANLAVVNSDLLVVAGSRFSERITGNREEYKQNKTIIHLDIDPGEVNKNVVSTMALLGDMVDTLKHLNPLVEHMELKDWWLEIKAWQKEDEELTAGHMSSSRLTAPWLLRTLQESQKEKDTYYVTDVGQNQMWAAQNLSLTAPRHFITSGGCGTMGFGVPAALGTKLAYPKADVVSISGDGGFKMTGMELYTAVQQLLPMLNIVINNSSLGMVKQWQNLFYDKRYSSTALPQFDSVQFAKSCGATGRRVTTCQEFLKALEEAKEVKDRPFVLEAVIDSNDMVFPMVAPGDNISSFV